VIGKLPSLILFFLGITGIAYYYSQRVLDWLRFQSLGTRDYIVERLAMMFIEIPPNKILMGLIGISFGMGSIVFLALLPNVVPGILFGTLVGFIGWKAPKPVIDWMYERRVKKFVLQMVDGLSLMSNGLKSGLSVVQSLSLVVQEMEDPIKQEFGLILSENKLGVALEEAFTNLSRRVRSDDVEMFVTSVNILKETGGNLAETFDTIVTTIRERIKVENKIDAMTSSGRIQGYVLAAIPAMLAVVFYQTDPDFMKPLFMTPLGWVVILIVLALDIVGLIVILKVVKVDV
jgi:tight adherence protein B